MEHSGQAFQSLDQPDHRQPIQVTVVERVSPDSVSFVLRNHAGIAFRSTLPIPIQPRNSTIQCIFLAYFTPQVVPFSMRRLITDENRSMVRPDRHYLRSTFHHPLLSALPAFLAGLCFHGLTNCFFRKPFVLKNICVAMGVSPSKPSDASICRDSQDLQRIKSFVFTLLRTPCRREKSHLDWNQQLPHSFAKTPGVGVGSSAFFVLTEISPAPRGGEQEQGIGKRVHHVAERKSPRRRESIQIRGGSTIL
jgi:hypothetical protein